MHIYLRRARATFLATALIVGSTSAAAAHSAQEPRESSSGSNEPRSQRPSSSADAPARAAKSYDFTGDEIDGARISPDGTTIFGLDASGHPSLIRLRWHFLADIVASAEKL